MSWVKKLRAKTLREEKPAARQARVESARELQKIKDRRKEVDQSTADIEKRIDTNGFSAAIKRTMVRRNA